MSEPARVPGRPRSAQADEAILDAAVDLLVERGIDGTSIELVARRAGVTRATVYRRYADKTALLIAAIHHTYPGLPDELPEPRGIEEMLSWWARSLGEMAAGRGYRLQRRLMTSLHDHPEIEESFVKVSVEPRHRWIRATLERERDRGRFPPDSDLEIVRQILTGAVGTYLATHPDCGTTQEIERFLLAVLRETRYRPTS